MAAKITFQRVNFLVGGGYVLTYRNMALIVAGWILFCGLVHVGLIGLAMNKEGRLKTLESRAQVLQSRQAEQVQLLELSKQKVQTGTAVQSLASLFKDTPRWSRMLHALVAVRPGDIDLVRVAAERDKESAQYLLVIDGTATDTDAITALIEAMHKTPLFQDAKLENSSRDTTTNRMKFVVRSQVQFAES